jgi:hypothetical protein
MNNKVAQFNNFTGGVTSELRVQYEIPKFARLWNFDVSSDRAIQNYGFDNLINTDCHILEYNDNSISISEQWFLKRNSFLAIDQTGLVTVVNTDIDMIESTFTLGSDVVMETVPIIFNNHIVWLSESGSGATSFEVWLRNITTGVEFTVLTDLTDDEANSQNTFFLKGADGNLYIFSNTRVHRIDVPDSDGKFNSGNELSAYQPITQFMQSPNRNGNVGTYTGLNGPETQIITQIDEAQSILKILRYYDGPIDGVFGPATSAAVSAFQSDYFATGNVPGGDSYGDPLVVDGIIGPETQAVMNAVDDFSNLTHREKKNVLVLPDIITAVCNNGGFINISTFDKDGNAVVYFWDRTITAEGIGQPDTSVYVGQGIIQILKPLNDKLIAIMSPATTSEPVNKYSSLSVYAIQAGFDLLPESYAILLRSYRLRMSDGSGSAFDPFRFNYINQKSIKKDNRLYFSGRIHLQHYEDTSTDEGAFSGVMSVDGNGNLFTDVSDTDNSGELTYQNILSFGLIDSGFVVSQDGEVKITFHNTDTSSGLITPIINAGEPWYTKKIKNIYLAFDDTSDMDSVELYIREVKDKNDSDAGWVLVYDGLTSAESRTFENRVIINRNTVTGEYFNDFRELQIMLKIKGKKVELLDLTLVYTMLELNK